MDAQVGPSTEKVCISLTDVSTGQVIATECFYADSDFDCCSFSFSNFDFSDATRLLIDPCKDYQVSVQVNNKCDANLATQSFLWNNDPTFSLVVLPNVITPNSDGVNDSWRVQAIPGEFRQPELNAMKLKCATLTSVFILQRI